MTQTTGPSDANVAPIPPGDRPDAVGAQADTYVGPAILGPLG